MEKSDCQYFVDHLQIRLIGQPSEKHAELIESLLVVFVELADIDSRVDLGPLYELVLALTPSAEQLRGDSKLIEL